MTQELSAVCLELDGLPESSALVRAALTGLAEIHGLDAELFDDVKTAVTEACNNVVLYAYEGKPGRYMVAFEVRPGGVEATIRDWGSGIQHAAPSEDRMGVGLAVISALADRAEFISVPEGGTEVRMAWGAPDIDGRYAAAIDPGPSSGLPRKLTGGVAVKLSPPAVLPGVLRRVARAVAARTHLSLDRFADIDRLSEGLGAAVASAAEGEVTFTAAGAGRRLELMLGPLADDELPGFECERVPGSALVRVVIAE